MRRAQPPANAVALVLAAGNERPATSEFQEVRLMPIGYSALMM